MPWGLHRYQNTGDLHFVTFSCYRRHPLLTLPQSRDLFEAKLEQVRRWYEVCILGYVVMPEHVHLLVSEPERTVLSMCIQMLKQMVGKRLAPADGNAFWQRRYYDRNVHSADERINALNYIHRNPVKRGLVSSAGDWKWSSFRHHTTGVEGVVEIESVWTARKRERMGIVPTVRSRQG